MRPLVTDGKNALHLALEFASANVVRRLLECGASPNAQGKHSTVLNAMLLIDASSPDRDGNSPLHIVCTGRHGGNLTVKLLFQFDADPNIQGKGLLIYCRPGDIN